MFRALTTALLIALPAWATSAYGADLTLHISNVPEGGGTLMIAVVAGADAFDGDGPAIASFQVPAKAPAVTVSTTALSEGSYAIRVMHDRNGNGQLDSNLVGMPTEPWGFSNDASGAFGPPAWEDARFELAGVTVQQITLNH